SASQRIACVAQGHGTISVVVVATPSPSARMIAAFFAWHIPKSSALMISKRASAGYPSRSLALRLCVWRLELCHAFLANGTGRAWPRREDISPKQRDVHHQQADRNRFE